MVGFQDFFFLVIQSVVHHQVFFFRLYSYSNRKKKQSLPPVTCNPSHFTLSFSLSVFFNANRFNIKKKSEKRIKSQTTSSQVVCVHVLVFRHIKQFENVWFFASTLYYTYVFIVINNNILYDTSVYFRRSTVAVLYYLQNVIYCVVRILNDPVIIYYTPRNDFFCVFGIP